MQITGFGTDNPSPTFTAADLDKKFLIPAVKIIQKDAKNRLELLNRQRAYLIKESQRGEQEIPLLSIKQQDLKEKKAEFERELDKYKKRWLPGGTSTHEIENKLMENIIKIFEVQETLNYYDRLPILQKRIDKDIRDVTDSLNRPIEYLVKILPSNMKNSSEWGNKLQGQLLPQIEKEHRKIAQQIKDMTDDEYIQSTISGQHPLGRGAWAVSQELILTLFAKEALELRKIVHDQQNRTVMLQFEDSLKNYVNNLFNNPTTVDNRITILKQTSPLFSSKEPMFYDTSLVIGFISYVCQVINNTFKPSISIVRQQESRIECYQNFLETRIHPCFERYVQPNIKQLERHVKQSPTLRHLSEISMERLESHGFGSPFQ